VLINEFLLRLGLATSKDDLGAIEVMAATGKVLQTLEGIQIGILSNLTMEKADIQVRQPYSVVVGYRNEEGAADTSGPFSFDSRSGAYLDTIYYSADVIGTGRLRTLAKFSFLRIANPRCKDRGFALSH